VPLLLLCKYNASITRILANKSVPSAFTIPIFLRVFFVRHRFRPGPWNLGRFSIPIGAFASAFVALMVPVLCFPSVTGSELTLADMNWTCVVYGGPMFFVTIWWFVSAHKWFTGPKINIQHTMLGGEEAIVEGQRPPSDANDEDGSSGERVLEKTKS